MSTGQKKTTRQGNVTGDLYSVIWPMREAYRVKREAQDVRRRRGLKAED
jgi:hypothetical protein